VRRSAGELGKSEVSQLQAAALDAIKRHGKISALFILENFEGWKQTGDRQARAALVDHAQRAALGGLIE
jgi:hypothetical protein